MLAPTLSDTSFATPPRTHQLSKHRGLGTTARVLSTANTASATTDTQPVDDAARANLLVTLSDLVLLCRRLFATHDSILHRHATLEEAVEQVRADRSASKHSEELASRRKEISEALKRSAEQLTHVEDDIARLQNML